ncbi:MAG: heavy metal-binding domain-containing protein, partial [Candidatus Competibacterales bacterium]|nr:heavy metal-binding domain-containing protein [Candidatus Competibacterales bacterium]
MTVDPSSAVSAEHAGEKYYFCRPGCRDKFLADPQRYFDYERPASNDQGPGLYICPMCEGVEQQGPGTCPKCGMALERAAPAAPQTRTQYTCPMHPEIVRDEPGSCPICGMALEPVTVTVEEEENPELVDMTRRFWISAALSLPLLIIAMGGMIPGNPLHAMASAQTLHWLELLLATPVVLWGGWPFFVRGWQSLVTRHLNMFTLIALGTGVAYVYSVVATMLPGIFPAS